MKQLKKYWFSGFVYASILFLLIALYRADYLVMPEIYSFKYLALSIFTMCMGFIFHCLGWKQIMDGATFPISVRHSLISTGLAVFGKYIPGKLWALVGQAGYIVNEYDYPKKDLTGIITTAQVIAIWVGLILSVMALALSEGFERSIQWFMWAMLAGMTIIIFTNLPVRMANGVFKLLGKGETVSTLIGTSTLIRTALMYMINWILWCIGFYLLVIALTGQSDVNYSVGLSYAMALILGFLVLIVPGGLGIREGVLVTYLFYAGHDLTTAATISVASRLWFMCGEFFIFILAIILNKQKG